MSVQQQLEVTKALMKQKMHVRVTWHAQEFLMMAVMVSFGTCVPRHYGMILARVHGKKLDALWTVIARKVNFAIKDTVVVLNLARQGDLEREKPIGQEQSSKNIQTQVSIIINMQILTANARNCANTRMAVSFGTLRLKTSM